MFAEPGLSAVVPAGISTYPVPLILKLPAASHEGPGAAIFAEVTVPSPADPMSRTLPYEIIKQLTPADGATAKLIWFPVIENPTAPDLLGSWRTPPSYTNKCSDDIA